MPLRTSFIAIAITLAFAALSAPACGDDIRLKAASRLPFDADAVRLGDIAELVGPEAAEYAGVIIAPIDRLDHPLEISIRDVRARLDEAGVHWGRVNLSGRTVTVRPRRTPAANRPAAMDGAVLDVGRAAKAVAAAEVDDLTADVLVNEKSLRGIIARTMVRGLEVEPADLRLLFSRDDQETLAMSEVTYRIELQPLSSLRSDRVKLLVRGWQAGRVEIEETVQFQPLVRVRTAVLSRDVRRNDIIDPEGFEVRSDWFSPVQAELLCDPSNAAGRIVSRSLDAGTVLRQQHAKRAKVVERGDRLNVRCLVGGVVILLQAEACEGGAEGDTIECRKLGERERFTAIVRGAGEAIVDLAQ